MAEMISIREAAQTAPISYQQISNLARSGRIKARKSGNMWLVDPDSLKEYLQEMEELGNKKHTPHSHLATPNNT